MWCFQNPEFEALLITELQRQQQYSQFCDTLLRAEDMLVPAHSCILSAFSSYLSSALSSSPPPPAGQKHLLEFQSLRSCTLLHIIRLLYSGEMEGEGEKEKQEAISAAAKLGIHGLVEVSKRDWRCRHVEGAGQCVEVGVQTEPQEKVGNWGHWRREVRDGDICLWKEMISEGGQDVWTQTDEVQIDVVAPSRPHPATSYQTIDIDAFQSLGQTNSQLVLPQVVPISIVYPPDVNQTAHPSAPLQESTTEGSAFASVMAPQYTSSSSSFPHYSNQMTPGRAEPQNWSASQEMASENLGDESFEQFEGNIPGFISYFFDPHKEERSSRRRAGRRRERTRSATRRRGTGVKKPRGRRGRTAQGTLTQTVVEQEVLVVGRLQKLFLNRTGGRAGRMGQGGGAAGRKMQSQTRELLNSRTSFQRRRVRNKVWEVNQAGDLQLCRKVGRGGSDQIVMRNLAPTQKNQDALPISKPQMLTTESSSSGSSALPPVCIHPVNASRPSGSAFRDSPSPSLQPPGAPYMSPAASLLHTCSLPPMAPPQQHVDQPEQINRLLEEVMMGLDILPNSTSKPPPACSRSPGVVAVVREDSGARVADAAMPVMEQEAEGEMNKMLDQFLESFEQHVERASVEKETSEAGCSEAGTSSTVPSQYEATHSPGLQNTNVSQHVRPPEAAEEQSDQASRSLPCSPKHTKNSLARRPVKRKQKQYLLSLEKRKVTLKTRTLTCAANMRVIDCKGQKQLQQIPVVKLKRSTLLPDGVTLQDFNCQSFREERSETASPRAITSGKKPQPLMQRKTYPTRSRFKDKSEIAAIIENPLEKKPSAGQLVLKRGRPRKNGLHVNPSSSNQRQEENQQTLQRDSTTQPQGEAQQPGRKRRKKKRKLKEKPSDEVATKRVCVDQTAQQLMCDTATSRAESEELVSEQPTVEPEEAIDIETISLHSVEDGSQVWKPVLIELALGKPEESLMDEQSSDCSEIIDVEMEDWDEEEERSSTPWRIFPELPAQKFSR